MKKAALPAEGGRAALAARRCRISLSVLYHRGSAEKAQQIGRVTLYGDFENIADKVGIVVFNIAGRLRGEVAREMAKWRVIAVRQGAFCSHPYVW